MKKLVPIDADLAGRAAAAGRRTGRGYYQTVNDMLRQHAQMIDAAPVALLVAAVTECLPDLAHYVATHGPGPDRRLEELRRALQVAQDATRGADVTPGDGETAKQILRDMLRHFPGFITDEDVNGGDLVDYMSMCAADIENATGGPAMVRELSVCSDCLEVVAYGDDNSNGIDADRCGEIAVAIGALLEKHPGATLHAGEELREYSRAACHVCGSKLHGARHSVTLFKA